MRLLPLPHTVAATEAFLQGKSGVELKAGLPASRRTCDKAPLGTLCAARAYRIH
jgi:hypothetical protein